MQTQLPPQLEAALQAYVEEVYLPPRQRRKGLRFFLPAIAELSEAFTADRGSLPKNYLNHKAYRSAYLLYFFLTNYAKVTFTLSELQRLRKLPTAGEIRLLDVGAGPATASIAAAYFFQKEAPEVKLSCDLLEQNRPIAHDGEALFRRLITAPYRIRSFERFSKGGGHYDLIIAANVLNELKSMEKQEAFTSTLLRQLNPNGSLVLIDPALRFTTRALMELRDRLVASKLATVLAPCLHQHHCPMRAANSRDWCHFYLDWECPKLIRDIDRAIGNKHDYLKFAYFIFTSPLLCKEGIGGGRKGGEQSARVVSSPLISKGKTELLLCSSAGKLERLRELDRDRQKGKLRFGGARRGDIIPLANDR